MASLKITFDDRQFKKTLTDLLREWHNIQWGPIFTVLAKQFRKSKRAHFMLKSPGGYIDLNPIYKKHKNREWGFAYPILKASGAMMRSVINASDSDAFTKIYSRGSHHYLELSLIHI